MLTYKLEKKNGVALYDLLYRNIRDDILTGKLAAGEKLPSKRLLAENLGVSVITVEDAYAQLVSEGYIYPKERSGFFVEKVQQYKPKAHTDEQTEIEESYAVDFTSNKLYSDGFPFSVWAKLMRETLLNDCDKLIDSEPHAGAYDLRVAIVDYLYRSRGIETSPDRIIVGAGTEYMVTLLVQLLGHEYVYGMEDPGYSKTASIYRANEVTCLPLPLDEYGISMPELRESETDILHISPNHHYPTGIITPIQRRQELLAWANESERRYIIEDDYDSEFRFSGRPIPTLQSIDTTGKVIYINTFSKSLSPSIRISYMILPEGLMASYRKKLGFYASAVPGFEQHTLAKFIERGYFERHLARMKNIYKKRRNEIIEKIATLRHADRYTLIPTESGLHFLLKVETNLSDEILTKRALEKKIRISFISEYSVLDEKKYEHLLLLNYSKEKYDDLSFLDDMIE